ncbi:hypothetical protein [Aliikangiella sp. IMCC44632]
MLLSITFAMLFSCSSKRADPFSESFYTFESADKLPSFSFILALKGTQIQLNNEQQAIHDYQTGESTARARSNQNLALTDDPQDRLVSLKFKMEEEAHKRLAKKLKASGFCNSNIVYQADEYTHGRYKISGHCAQN